MENKLNKIIYSCKKVSEKSKHVKINYEKLDEIIDVFDISQIKYWLDSNPFNILNLDSRTIVNFLLVYHTIGDYCFWGEPKWEINTENGILDGSYAMMYLLINRIKSKNDFNLTYDEFKNLLSANVEIPLIEDRYDNLVMMNKFFNKVGKDFYSQVESMTTDKELFNYIISNFNYFIDESKYNNEMICFYKRAQLLTSDILHVREILENISVDYTHLAGCADYKIPQVMRCYGILDFDEELSNFVDNKIEIKKDSDMEIEIRANDIVVIDYIANKLDNKVSRIDINDYIWLLGQDKSKMVKYYHRTLTNKY
jgi:hypothetical protein